MIIEQIPQALVSQATDNDNNNHNQNIYDDDNTNYNNNSNINSIPRSPSEATPINNISSSKIGITGFDEAWMIDR